MWPRRRWVASPGLGPSVAELRDGPGLSPHAAKMTVKKEGWRPAPRGTSYHRSALALCWRSERPSKAVAHARIGR